MIRGRDVAWVAVWALGTIGVAALACGTGRSVAEDVRLLPAPVFQVNGLSVRIEPIAEAPVRPGAPARVRLVADNPGSADVSARVRVQLMATAPSSSWSRVPSFPSSFYDCERELIVRGGRSLAVELASDQPVPAGSITAVISEAVPAPQAAGEAVGLRPLMPPGAVVFALASAAPEAQVTNANGMLVQVAE